MKSRAALAALSLVVAGLAAVALPAAPSSAEVFAPRWCGTAAPPCVTQAFRKGVEVTASDPDWKIDMSGFESLSYTKLFYWVAMNKFGTWRDMPVGDEWTITFDTGSFKPRLATGFGTGNATGTFPGGGTWARTDDGDGTYHLTINATSVRRTRGCVEALNGQYACPQQSTDWGAELNGQVWDLATDTPAGDASWRSGFARWQNVEATSGDPITAPTSDGSVKITFSTWNSATYNDGGTKVFRGSFGLRMPYAYVRERLEVPDPETLPVSGLIPSIGGSGSAGDLRVVKEPHERAFYVSSTGITYPFSTTARGVMARAAGATVRRDVNVKRGRITPYAPKSVSAKRTAARAGRVSYAAAKARGARPTGYTVFCVNGAKTHRVTVKDTASPTPVTGLRRGVAYDCRVWARSRAGAGTKSVTVRIARRP